MPVIYAIEEYTPNAITYGKKLTRWNSDVTYHEVPQEVAESDEERGVFCLTNNDGKPITHWTCLNDAHVKQAMLTVKNTGGPHADILGEELAVGDWVGFASNSIELGIGRVIGFTKEKVRFFDYSHHFGTIHMTLKPPAALMKIQSTKFSE